ncbi:DUF2491 family protein [Cognatilysobacter bugurensis]|uniref:DUF2491 family protein n=1 Tax=Cognatilysobacter bugurensis TaxID=543356 RepID=A0A918T2Y6_9GAMM|nr:DUF2491 family protein [Lysobacter bugurensis]GHA87685.1 hypothetical protein GCM10007067_27130 [Lysobacter bugurensis]
MSWLDRLRGKSTPPALPDPSALGHPLPLGFRVNGRVAFDTLVFRAHPDALTVQLPEGHQGIPAYGHIDLGAGHALHRFYLDDDAYVQVSTAGELIEGIKAFVFVETVNPPTQAEFQRFIHGHEHLGAPSIEYMGRQWQRDFSGEASGRIPPVIYDEVLYRHDPPRRDDDLTHYAMLYRREVPELARDEFLLVTAEDYGPAEFLVTYAIGLDINTADLDIT